LYRQNYGDSISGLTGDVATVFASLGGLGSDKDLERATAKALSFGQAFSVDVTDAVQSVSTLVGSGLVKDSNEAFDLLTASAQKVPAALRENVFEASDEYSQFFRTLGFDGNEAFDALVQGAKKGEFGIDKTGDAIKEFTILSTDMSESTVGAYESIGLNATDMTNAILAGGDQAKGAFDQITSGILSIEDPAAQSQAALALFGTPLEDMNVQDIPEFIAGLQGVSARSSATTWCRSSEWRGSGSRSTCCRLCSGWVSSSVPRSTTSPR
jgi:phage-related minor tail protein